METKEQLFSIEICYLREFGEVCYWRMRNYSNEMKNQLRLHIFEAGFIRDVSPGVWEMVPPRRIVNVLISLQAYRFDENDLAKDYATGKREKPI